MCISVNFKYSKLKLSSFQLIFSIYKVSTAIVLVYLQTYRTIEGVYGL